MLREDFDQHGFFSKMGWLVYLRLPPGADIGFGELKIEWVGMLRPKFSGGIAGC